MMVTKKEKNFFYCALRARCAAAIVSVSVDSLFIRFTRKQSSMRFRESLTRPAGNHGGSGGKNRMKKLQRDKQFLVVFLYKHFFINTIRIFSPPENRLNSSGLRCKSDTLLNRRAHFGLTVCSANTASGFALYILYVSYVHGFCSAFTRYRPIYTGYILLAFWPEAVFTYFQNIITRAHKYIII